MAYKIVWSRGGETASRYSSKAFAKAVLEESNFSGRVFKTKLGNAGRTAPSREFRFGDSKSKNFPRGKKLKWTKRRTSAKGVSGIVYTKHI